MIELKNITKKFADKTAVDDVSIKINKGEIVGFLGPNGAGKTTTMRIITGFFLPDSGQVLLEGKDVSIDPVKFKSKIGYMPENNPLYKDMMVKEVLDLVLDLHKIPAKDRKEKLDKVIKATGLEDVYYKTISELSKGYKQRVGLAQVLIQDPEILILDEPTEGLDPNQRSEIRDLIKNLGKERTVIVSTHVMQEVEAMCNRIVIINAGKIIADGSKNEILKSKKGNLITLKVKSPKGNVVKADFNDISNNVEVTQSEGFFEVSISSDSTNIFEQITKKLKSKDWVIYELNQKTLNLEEVFKELTSSN